MDGSDHVSRKREKWRSLRRKHPAAIEIPGPGQESVWDYPRPPRVESVHKRIRVKFGGILLADTMRAYRVLETSSPPVYYLPPDDVRVEHFERSGRSTFCEWKGTARYWSIKVGERYADNAAWSYPEPDVGFEVIRDYVALYAGRMDACYVGDYKVRPQPGRFYGGWITPDVVGPFKGEPGTEGW